MRSNPLAERNKMAEKLNGMSVPVRQEDLWSAVRFAGVKAKTWKGEESKKNGLTVYKVEVLGIYQPSFKTYGNGGGYFTISVPMTEEEFTKLSHEKPDTLLQFDGLTAHYYEGQSYTAKGVSPTPTGNNIQLPKA